MDEEKKSLVSNRVYTHFYVISNEDLAWCKPSTQFLRLCEDFAAVVGALYGRYVVQILEVVRHAARIPNG